jgi:pilus assembly protein FimV
MADKDQNQNLDDSSSLDEDLEEYGVWVKAGPEDVDENEGESLFGLADLDEEEETTLTTEEEDLLADLEESEPEAEESASIESLDLEADDLSLDDLDLPEPSFEDDLADLTLDQEEPTGAEEEEPPLEAASDESLDSLIEDEGLDLEGIPGSEQDDFEELVIEEEEELVGSEDLPELEYEEEQPSFDAETSFDEIELEEPVFEEEEAESIEVDGEPLPSPQSLEEDFDDISAVEASMTAPVSEPLSESVSAEGQDRSEADGRVLATIEEELASIKTELHQLRAELASFRGGQTQAPESRAVETALPEEGEDVTGFFDEDEDETIALTGDELDNILNTAEFTEEAGKPSDYEDFDLAADFEDSDILGEGEDLIPDSMELTEPQEEVEEHTEVAAVDLDLGGFQHEPDDESPIEEITLEDIEEETGGTEDLMIGSEDVPALELPEEETFGGDDEDVAALAEMDIESELAGIDELKDEPETEEISFEAEEIEEEAPEEPVDEDAIEIDLSGIDEGEVSEPEELADDTELIEEEIEEEIVEEIDVPEEATSESSLPADLKGEIRSVLSYMDQLLEALPEDKIEEFARSEHFEVYKRLFEELGLEQR